MIGLIASAGGWLVARIMGRALWAKLLLVLVAVAVPLAGGAMWYAKHVYDDRQLARLEAEAWKVAADGWAQQWIDENALREATDELRRVREGQLAAADARLRATEDRIGRLRRSLKPVRDYLETTVPDELDAELLELERAAGAPAREGPS